MKRKGTEHVLGPLIELLTADINLEKRYNCL